MFFGPGFELGDYVFAADTGQFLARDKLDAGHKRRVGGFELGHGMAVPDQPSVIGQLNVSVSGSAEARGTGSDFECDHGFGGFAQHRCMHAFGLYIGYENKTLQAADIFALHQHFAVTIYSRH